MQSLSLLLLILGVGCAYGLSVCPVVVYTMEQTGVIGNNDINVIGNADVSNVAQVNGEL